MSIIGLIGNIAVSQQTLFNLISLITALIAFAIFIKSRAYRPRSIAGPQRLPPDEPLAPLVFVMIGGLSLWMLVPFLILKFLHRNVPVHEIKPTHTETVILGIVGGAVPLFFMLLGTFTRRQRGLETLGLGARHLKKAVAPALAGFVFIIPLVSGAAIFTEWLMRKYQVQHPLKHELLNIMDEVPSPLIRILIAVGAVIVAPLFEEFLFRGHVQTILARGIRRPWLAVIITSLFFALVHQWSIALPIFILSLCLGYMYERTGNLWVSVLMHAMFNGFSILLNLLHVASH